MGELVILDFDGTCTDAHAEAKPFFAGYRADLFDLIGRDPEGEEATAAWDAAMQELRDNPGGHGFRIDGVISAPALADPYLMAGSAAQLVCDQFGVLQKPELRSEVLQILYRNGYARTSTVPRPDAREVIEALVASPRHVAVVTNSATKTVEKKLDNLNIRGRDQLTVIGDARKFLFDAPTVDSPRRARFAELEDLRLPGLDARPVAIRRGCYFDVLETLWAKTASGPEQTLVCGDIFELDLALPMALGARVHLVCHAYTPDHEKAYVDAHPRGGSSAALTGVLERL